METSEFAMEFRKIEEKDVSENSYAMFQTEKHSVIRRCSSK